MEVLKMNSNECAYVGIYNVHMMGKVYMSSQGGR